MHIAKINKSSTHTGHEACDCIHMERSEQRTLQRQEMDWLPRVWAGDMLAETEFLSGVIKYTTTVVVLVQL